MVSSGISRFNYLTKNGQLEQARVNCKKFPRYMNRCECKHKQLYQIMASIADNSLYCLILTIGSTVTFGD